MYYSSIGILAVLILIINNYNILIQSSAKDLDTAHNAYKNFLRWVFVFYMTDILWGPLYELRKPNIALVETSIFFVVMALSVMFWIKYVLLYLKENNRFLRILRYTGWIFVAIQIIVIIINFFIPIAFRFEEDGTYKTGVARNANLAFQIIMFAIVNLYMIYASLHSRGNVRRRHRAIGIFSVTMVICIIFQIFFAFLPFYTIGYMLGTCLLHTFVLEDEKDARREQLESMILMEKLQEVELGKTRQMAYSDPLTGVKNKMAYIEDVGGVEQRIKDDFLKNFGLVIFDLNDLKKVNDTKGHDAGDQYIKSASSLICNFFKHSPVYRIGGDEFVVFLSGEDYNNRNSILVNFNNIIEDNLETGGVVIALGYADYEALPEKDYMRLFEQADKMMYQRKQELKAKKLKV